MVGEVDWGGGFAIEDVVSVGDGEVVTGFKEGDEEGGSFGDAEIFFEDGGFQGEVAEEGRVGAGDDDDFVRVFLEDGSEGLVELGGLFFGEGAGVGEEEKEGGGFVDRVADGVGIELGEDGDVEDGLGAGGVIIEDDDGALR